MSTYNETLEYLYSQLPMYQNVGSSAIKKDLTNIRELCRRLGNPEEKFKVIHVAGTNGKGSVSHLMAAALQANGLKTGLITSPHLIDFRERTRVNGKLVPEEYVIEFTERIKNEIADLKPSFFEIGVALGFQYMADQQVDVAVVETGLGGRLDSTNVVDPLLSIITNISYDHKDHLGYTLPEIAFEKTGIIKPNKPVLIGRNQSEVNHVFLSKSLETDSPIHWAYEFMEETWHNANGSSLSCNYSTKNYGELRVRCDLPGIYQIENIATVLSASIILKDQLHLSLEKCVASLQDVKTSTGLRGRWDILSKKPLIVADITHNMEAFSYQNEMIQKIDPRRVIYIVGFSQNKELGPIFIQFRRTNKFIWTQANVQRAISTDTLKNLSDEYQLDGEVCQVEDALDRALSYYQSGDLILVTGSVFVVADIMKVMIKQNKLVIE